MNILSTRYAYNTTRRGFTIVELLIVIVVIGILAALTIVSYNGVKRKAIITTIISDLSNSAQQMAIDRVSTDQFPATAAAVNGGLGLPASPGTTYQFTVNNTVTPPTFCITGTNSLISYFVTQDSVPAVGACPGDVAGTSNPPQYAWTSVPVSGVSGWGSVAMSSTGSIMVATPSGGGKPYVSTDFGATWTLHAPGGSGYLARLAISSNGLTVLSTDQFSSGYLNTSVDGGINWDNHPTVNGTTWADVAVSGDGVNLIAAPTSGYLYFSANSGSTWATKTSSGSRSWGLVGISKTGNYITAYGGSVYTSTNLGTSWTSRTAPNVAWKGLAMSDDGSKQYLAASTGSVVAKSSDYGVTWSALPNVPVIAFGWAPIATSADGTKLIVGGSYSEYLYTSSDSGNTWTAQTSLGKKSWKSLTMSGDGTRFLAAPSSGDIVVGRFN